MIVVGHTLSFLELRFHDVTLHKIYGGVRRGFCHYFRGGVCLKIYRLLLVYKHPCSSHLASDQRYLIELRHSVLPLLITHGAFFLTQTESFYLVPCIFCHFGPLLLFLSEYAGTKCPPQYPTSHLSLGA